MTALWKAEQPALGWPSTELLVSKKTLQRRHPDMIWSADTVNGERVLDGFMVQTLATMLELRNYQERLMKGGAKTMAEVVDKFAMSPWQGHNPLDLALALALVSLDAIEARATDPVAAAAKKARAILDAGIAAEEEARADWEAREEAAEEEARLDQEAGEETAAEEALLNEEARAAGWKPEEEEAQEAHWKKIAEFGGWDHGKGAP